MQQKYSVIKAFSKPFLDITDNSFIFLKIAGAFSLVLALLSFVFGQTFACTVPALINKTFCPSNVFSYIVYLPLKLFILSVFLRTWYDNIYLQKQIDFSYFKTNIRSFFKFFGLLIVFIAFNSLPALAFYLLLVRNPNPVWQIELVYFTFVSLGFIIPFVSLRFYSNLALLVENRPWRSFKEIYQKTQFKLSKIFFSFAVVLGISLLLFLSVNNSLKANVFEPLLVYNILGEYLFELVFLFIFTLMLNFIRVQKESFE
ncbi:MAG TPA: hypothetical protein DIC64_05055 [Alphaproteobacteria bacterium]|nr:hypothetical protein [Alphaproteobacteria bacterium]